MKSPSPSTFAAKVRFASGLENALGSRRFKHLARGGRSQSAVNEAVRWNEQLPPADQLSVCTVPELFEWLSAAVSYTHLTLPTILLV